MKTNTTPTNVANLLTAAAYIRNETIINGNQAAHDYAAYIVECAQYEIANA